MKEPAPLQPSAVPLSRLAAAAGGKTAGNGQTLIRGLAYHSRLVKPGDLFMALPGHDADGGMYIDDALRRGAVAVLYAPGTGCPRGISGIEVVDPRRAMADIAVEFFGHPSEHLNVIGVTGTNGKTTTTFMIQRILQRAGKPTALIGTIHYEFGERRVMAIRTTPEAPDIQRMLFIAGQGGCHHVAMEVSSQGLAAERVNGTRFAAAVFTNLSVDHLDFHHTMEAYFAEKKRLFDLLAEQAAATPAVINTDDAYGRRLAAEPSLSGRLLTYGFNDAAMVRAENCTFHADHAIFTALTPWGNQSFQIPFAGRFNILNALAAIAVAGHLGIPLAEIAAALKNMPPVPGRLEYIADPSGKRHVFVDYAHTEEALANVLQTLKENAPGRLICVFGCGGDRDRGKRPKMGAVVARLADLAIVTSDNPRTEEPAIIICDIVAGMGGGKNYRIVEDRREAIILALDSARPGDTVLIAGKGHETYQEIGRCKVEFDDRRIVRDYFTANE